MLKTSAVYEIRCLAGATLMHVFGERCSRRTWMMAGILVMAAGATLQTAAHQMSELMAGRVLTGLVRDDAHESCQR